MTTSAPVSYLTLEFDDFLFAQINKNGEETPLSVLSVLARLGADPWEGGRQTGSIAAPHRG